MVSKKYKTGITVISAANLNKTGLVNLWAHEKDTPDMQVYVESGMASINGTFVAWAGGNSPTFTAPTGGNKRIDLLILQSDGTLAITQGTQSGSPSAPAYPTNAVVVCEVYLRTSATTILQEDDSTNCYIYKDSRAFAVGAKGLFGGTGADGALNVTSGTTTIYCANAKLVVKQYTSINVSSGATLAFSNPATGGTLIMLKSQGNITIAGTVNASSMGAAGGAKGASSANAYGSDGSYPANLLDTLTTHGGGGTSGRAGQAGTQYGSSFLFQTQNYKWTMLAAGSGGGGGQTSGLGDAGTANGGRGGGALYFECGGAWNFTGTINTSGANGGTGGNGNQYGNSNGGGGGGGAAGDVFVLYNSLTADSGTYTVSGGSGGSPGGGHPFNYNYGGGGGGNTNSAGSGAGQGGGAAGANAVAVREKNATWQ